MDDATIATGFAKFGGVKRRFSKVGEIGGATVIDDYAHHPVEIRAVLSAARDSIQPSSGNDGIRDGGRVIAVVQPHRFTRLRDLMEDFSTCFSDADSVIVADVYPAGEQPIDGIDKHALVDGVRRFGHRAVQPLESVEALPGLVRDEAKPGDLVVFLGAQRFLMRGQTVGAVKG